MKRFSAQIRHQYDTILRMCRVQYDTFCFGRKLAMAALGLALAVCVGKLPPPMTLSMQRSRESRPS